jgi:glycosyltransferase involved in cell wall biosynthesis
MKTRVTLHRFVSDKNLKQRDGVNLAHTEINELLTSQAPQSLDIHFHDFDKLLRDEKYARDTLTNVDCVLCNVGPNAQYYHFLREKYGLNFRIIRDIKTALWSCYLLQESLCEPFIRSGDVLLATSNYSRKLIRKLFPSLINHPIELFEPVLSLESFPENFVKKINSKMITLGHIGRLSVDKNFHQMIDLLINLERVEPGRYRLIACGSIHSTECNPTNIAEHLFKVTGRRDIFVYLAPMENQDVINLLSTFDFFLFFSTSNLEVLGRVLIECAYKGVRVLAANHAAAPELVNSNSLLPVKYKINEYFYTHFDHALGSVDIVYAQELIQSQKKIVPPLKPTMNNFDSLIKVINNDLSYLSSQPNLILNNEIENFINRLEWDGLPRQLSKTESSDKVDCLIDWFCALNGKHSPEFNSRLIKLKELSKFPDRTNKYLASITTTQGDFTDLGGMDMELCNIAQFHPKFRLKP